MRCDEYMLARSMMSRLSEDIGETHFGGFMKKKRPLQDTGEEEEEEEVRRKIEVWMGEQACSHRTGNSSTLNGMCAS